MDALQNLVVAFQADETLLRQQAQSRMESWQRWLTLSVRSILQEKTRVMTMISSVSGRRSINFPALIPG